MLKWLAVVAIFASILPIDVRANTAPSGGNQTNSDGTPNPPPLPASAARCEVKQDGTTIECQRSQAKPEGYFKRLFTAENTPNIGLFLVGLGGVLAAIYTLRAIERQSDIANRTLIAQFRPRVIVRNIELIKGAGLWGMHMEIENVGGTTANIKDAKIEVRWRVGNERRYQTLHRESFESFSLEAGQERAFNIAVSQNGRFEGKMNVFRIALGEGRPNKYTMQAVGVIRYADDSGAGKKTGYFRTLEFEEMRFVRSQNSEDEYQD